MLYGVCACVCVEEGGGGGGAGSKRLSGWWAETAVNRSLFACLSVSRDRMLVLLAVAGTLFGVVRVYVGVSPRVGVCVRAKSVCVCVSRCVCACECVCVYACVRVCVCVCECVCV